MQSFTMQCFTMLYLTCHISHGMVNFKDPGGGFNCQSEECRACTALILQGLRDHQGLKPTFLQDVQTSIGIPQDDLSGPPNLVCNRLSFGRAPWQGLHKGPREAPPPEIEECFRDKLPEFLRRNPPPRPGPERYRIHGKFKGFGIAHYRIPKSSTDPTIAPLEYNTLKMANNKR